MSRPVWARGLKLIVFGHFLSLKKVAPCVGAWIETINRAIATGGEIVAPCVGAWIETKANRSLSLSSVVAPCVARELKRVFCKQRCSPVVSRPARGTFYETFPAAKAQEIVKKIEFHYTTKPHKLAAIIHNMLEGEQECVKSFITPYVIPSEARDLLKVTQFNQKETVPQLGDPSRKRTRSG